MGGMGGDEELPDDEDDIPKEEIKPEDTENKEEPEKKDLSDLDKEVTN